MARITQVRVNGRTSGMILTSAALLKTNPNPCFSDLPQMESFLIDRKRIAQAKMLPVGDRRAILKCYP